MNQKEPLSFLSRITDTRTYSPTERTLLAGLLGLLAVSLLMGLYQLNVAFFERVPTEGGSLTEGIVGTPRFINPLLTLSESDNDLTTLIYSGLLKATPEGTLIPDLAERYTISDDGKTYTFFLRTDATFHDDTPVRADDVVFTITQAQNGALKSPRRANWDNVTVEGVSEHEVVFTLPAPYGPFLENATLGILPKHLWEDIEPEQFPFSQFNMEPMGSGPYRISAVTRTAAGLPESYELTAFENYTLGKPFITTLTLKLYRSEEEASDAFAQGEVEAVNSITPARLDEIDISGSHILRAPLPRIFGLFFNQNAAPLFTSAAVRSALNIALSRESIVQEVLAGYGRPAKGPIPPGVAEEISTPEETSSRSATDILESDGWKKDEAGIWKKKTKEGEQTLSFSIATSNAPELKHAAEMLKRFYEEQGFVVELKFFEVGDLNQNVIRPRRYDALLFGEIVGRELDLFPFWHSSQRNDPGLNIALYANISADRLLEDARTTSDETKRRDLLERFEEEIATDIPAVFLYSPDFIYVVPEDLGGVSLSALTHSGERFLNVHKWYKETEHVWPFLTSLTPSH
jgi:peptide/nickel transport system substrate-binding protein